MSWRISNFRLLVLFFPSSLQNTSYPTCHVRSEVSSFSLSLSFFLFPVLLLTLFLAGLLIECDPSIKSMILKYDEERHDYIVEDLDDENHLVIKESQLQNLKVRLDQVLPAP